MNVSTIIAEDLIILINARSPFVSSKQQTTILNATNSSDSDLASSTRRSFDDTIRRRRIMCSSCVVVLVAVSIIYVLCVRARKNDRQKFRFNARQLQRSKNTHACTLIHNKQQQQQYTTTTNQQHTAQHSIKYNMHVFGARTHTRTHAMLCCYMRVCMTRACVRRRHDAAADDRR